MSLVSITEALQKGPVSSELAKKLHDYQREFGIDDDDALIAVLAMMARSQVILETVPDELSKRAKETIELHQIVLRKQAGVIAQEMISDVAQLIQQANKPWKTMWKWFAASFFAGLVTATLLFLLALLIKA